jgi:serine/threonine-protein kinase
MADESLRRCSACEATLPPGTRFCGVCGRDAADPALVATERVALAPAPFVGPSTSPPLPPMRLLPGTKLSVYRIESVLGEGGMGVVYRAHDEARGRAVALKCLHTNLAGDLEIRRRFAREAKVLRAQSHPNIVAVYDFVEHEYLLAIVMELVEGMSLVQHVAKWRGRVPFAEILVVFRGVLEAVAEGHRHGVIHRDLKPDNILVSGGGGEALRPKVVDFGIAKILEGTTYTMTGALLGTCSYMSPEQVQRPHSADPRSDVYSLGITLYQVVTGQVPFSGTNHFAIMMAHVNEAPRPPSELRPDIPPLLERLILDCLAKDPAARPASCDAFRARLDEALVTFVSTRPPPDPGTLPPVLKGQGGEEMVLVPGGPFLMGKSRRTVEIDAFYMDRTPVTNREYLAFVEVTGYRPTDGGQSRFLSHLRRARGAPGGLRVLARRAGLRDVGGKAPPDRGRVGEGRARDRRAKVPLGPLGARDEESQLRSQGRRPDEGGRLPRGGLSVWHPRPGRQRLGVVRGSRRALILRGWPVAQPPERAARGEASRGDARRLVHVRTALAPHLRTDELRARRAVRRGRVSLRALRGVRAWSAQSCATVDPRAWP